MMLIKDSTLLLTFSSTEGRRPLLLGSDMASSDTSFSRACDLVEVRQVPRRRLLHQLLLSGESSTAAGFSSRRREQYCWRDCSAIDLRRRAGSSVPYGGAFLGFRKGTARSQQRSSTTLRARRRGGLFFLLLLRRGPKVAEVGDKLQEPDPGAAPKGPQSSKPRLLRRPRCCCRRKDPSHQRWPPSRQPLERK